MVQMVKYSVYSYGSPLWIVTQQLSLSTTNEEETQWIWDPALHQKAAQNHKLSTLQSGCLFSMAWTGGALMVKEQSYMQDVTFKADVVFFYLECTWWS